MTRLAPVATSSAAVKGARRPTTVAPSSSRRPVSSSVRVCLTTSRRARIAIATAPIMPILNVASAPMDVWSWMGPYNASVEVALLIATAAWRRDALSG